MCGTVIGGRAGLFLIKLVVAYQLAECQLLACCTSQYLPCVATSDASKVRRAGRGKPVLICIILASSLCFTP